MGEGRLIWRYGVVGVDGGDSGVLMEERMKVEGDVGVKRSEELILRIT